MSEQLTDERRKSLIEALIQERRGANADVKAIDAELLRLGAKGSPPAKRAAKRASKRTSASGSRISDA